MNNENRAAIISPNSVTLMVDNHTTPITSSHANYAEIRVAAAKCDWPTVDALLDLVKEIEDFGEGLVTVQNGEVMYNGQATHNAVTTRIQQMIEEGLEIAPMVAFLENLMLNPSYRSVQQLYGFLEVNDLPITEDGCFLAYKMCARTDDGKLTDIRTRTFDYSVGSAPSEMPRNQVNEDPDMTCSSGLHVCAQGYLGSYSSGENTILVKVNPADVVAVPTDYNNAKMRVCKHETVCEVTPRTRGDVYTSAVYTPAADTNLADTSNVLTKDEAIVALGLQGAADPKSALRKRLNRGTTCKRVFVNGEEMVQLIDTETEAEVATDDSVMTHAEAIAHFGLDATADPKAALRKRLNRGTTCKRVYPNGVEMVKVLNLD